MSGNGDWVPVGIDTSKPSGARVYDYLLGGGHNFAADRAAGERVIMVHPQARKIAASNRAFMRRAVRFMIEQGVTRFLDLGSGIPTVGNVHEIARRVDPTARVVYVDYEDVAVAHSLLILGDDPLSDVVQADLTEPDRVLGAEPVRRLLDDGEPVGLLMVAVYHFVPDAKDPAGLVARYAEQMPPGSLVAISHLTADHDPEEMEQVRQTMQNSPSPMYFRSHDEVMTLFESLDVVEPGVVDAPSWHPEHGLHDAELAAVRGVYAGVGRIR
ncbi:SAM-dependent methyltransferase [Saccharothrix deserti]|uniref:SAM-dependent methyltransferase n=1 Tax=Saccharothrix deserti TaxID=2593674 RepID=UPI00131C656D|nr:SAM-dependent methyltransferase [Saccharothrix deserti]